MAQATEVRCARCKAIKPLDEFNWADRARGARQEMCRQCFSDLNRKRYERLGDQIRAAVRARYKADPERARAEGRASRLRHLEARRAYAREYQRQHADERKSYKLEWSRRDRAANPEKWREKSRAAYRKNPLARKAVDHKRRAVKLATSHLPTPPSLLLAKWDHWGGRCWMCGAPAGEWDHVKPLSVGGYHCLANLRPACRSCNASKGNAWPWPRKES